jgi:cell division protein ZapA (FtsZ GTPase activity inhibitor)
MSKPNVPSSKEAPKAKPSVSKVTVILRGLEYVVTCDAGEEKKLGELVRFVNERLDEVAARAAGTNATEMRLFMLTCLMMADELIETRKAAKEMRKADEDLLVAAVEHLTDRVKTITQQVGRA